MRCDKLGSTVAILFAILFTHCPAADLPAFPGAEGYGAMAAGGRGGRVVRVTSLADSGPGTLRQALSVESGSRIVVFDIGGTIELTREIRILGESGSFVTVAGQTAPGGIQLAGAGIIIGDGAHDVVLRYLRIRCTIVPLTIVDGRPSSVGLLRKCILIVPLAKPDTICRRIIIDHCSLTGGLDDSLGMGDCEDVTVQWTIIAEGSLYGDSVPAGRWEGDPSWSRAGQKSQGFVIGQSCHGVTIHHCYLANNLCRNPLCYSDGRVDLVNNLTYNFDTGIWFARYGSEPTTQANVIGCAFARGPSTRAPVRPIAIEEGNNRGAASPTPGSIYVRDCVDSGLVDGDWYLTTILRWPGFTGWTSTRPEGYAQAYFVNGPALATYRAASPWPGPGVTTQSAATLWRSLLYRVGALPRDEYDSRLVREFLTRRGSIGIGDNQSPPTWAADGGVIASGHDPLPAIVGGKASADTDSDGMPDAWEIANGLDPRDPCDQHRELGGWPAIEQYLADVGIQ